MGDLLQIPLEFLMLIENLKVSITKLFLVICVLIPGLVFAQVYVNGEKRNLAVILYDWPETSPDFGTGGGACGGGLKLGYVAKKLDIEGKPGIGNASCTPVDLLKWFRTQEVVPGYNNAICYDLEITYNAQGLWVADYGRFFPMDNFTHLDEAKTVLNPWNKKTSNNRPHNYSFTMEIDAEFVYKKGQTFDFRGDDDVFVFINNELVVDIGGVHGPQTGNVKLDTLGLVEGNNYSFKIFFAERQESGSSFKMATSMDLRTRRELIVQTVNNGNKIIYEINERQTKSKQSCSLKNKDTDTVIAPSHFVLEGANILPKLLNEGLNLGGISIAKNSASIILDLEALKRGQQLEAGLYEIIISLKNDITQTDTIRFELEKEIDPCLDGSCNILKIQKASIFDDGNGIADSLVIDFEQVISSQNRFDSLTLYWGQDSNTYQWSEFKALNKKRVMLAQKEFSQKIFTGIVSSEDKSYLKIYYPDFIYQSDRISEIVIPIDDKVGPVLLEAFLHADQKQIVLATYSEKVAHIFDENSDSLLIYNIKNITGEELKYLYQGFSYTIDSLHSSVDHAQKILTANDSIKLEINYGIYDNQGNRPHINNRYVMLSPNFINNPLSASVYDNGDGIADSLMVDFQLGFSTLNQFDSLSFFWGEDTNTYSWDEFEIFRNMAILSQKEFSEEIYTGNQDMQAQSFIKIFYSDTTKKNQNSAIMHIDVKDKVGPVLLKASLRQGELQRISVKYSEKVQTSFNIEQETIIIYEIKNTNDQEFKYYFQDFDYTIDSLNSRVYQAEHRLKTKDSIRLTLANGVYDMEGNYPHENNHYVGVNYYKILDVKKSKIAQIPEVIFPDKSVDLQLVDRYLDVSKIPSTIQRVGIRYDLDFNSFLENYTTIDPSAIDINWQMELFTNLGGFVHQESGSVNCEVILFEGNCLEDNRMIYVGWNMKGKNGLKAATGGYIARVILKFTYNDTTITESDELWHFGLRRAE